MTNVTVQALHPISEPAVESLYQIREVRMDQDLSGITSAWRESNLLFQDHTIVCDPEWLKARFEMEKANICAYLFEKNGSLIGAVPLEFYHHHLDCRLGDLRVVQVPLNMVRLLGYTPNLPPEESAHDRLFERVLSLNFDAIYMTCIKADSFFWHYLQVSPLIKRHFYFYSVGGLRPHPFIRTTGSYRDYMQKFSSKTRNNFSRQLRRLAQRGTIDLVRIAKESEVNSFVDAAAEISRKTYQFRVLGIGIRNPDQLKNWLKWAARRGWLRSYLLRCGGFPCAFQVAYQYGRTFFGLEVGYDPAWRDFGVGIVQQLLALEDLFKDDKPNLCDFGGYADYKQFLANDSSSDANVWLFRRRPYPFLALSTYRLFNATSKAARSVLSRVNLSSKIKHLLRK